MAATKGEKRRREESKEEASAESFHLPPEIIREILIRLPAKSIGRFRCVSKLFCSLSSDPSFAKSHLDLTIHRKIIISGYKLYALDLDGIGDGYEGIIDLVAVELNYPLKDVPCRFEEITDSNRYRNCIVREELYRHKWVQIIGYSNGLVCMSPADDAFFLYNPTTGDSKRLPKLTDEQFETHGFGFDDLTNDYKVVKLVADSRHVLNASVYSLKADSWRPLCDLKYKRDDDGFVRGITVNGAIHWVFTLQETNQKVVLAFDVKTDEFREMALPGELAEAHSGFIVDEFNGRLCVVNSWDQEHYDVWVMNEYGVASSWTRIQINLLCKYMRPLCSTKNSDEVLLELEEDIALYNFKTHSLRHLGIRGANLSGEFEADTYIESPVSPNLYVVEN